MEIHQAMTLPTPGSGTSEKEGDESAANEDEKPATASSAEKDAAQPKPLAPVSSVAVSATAIDVEAVERIREICHQVLAGFYHTEEGDK